MIDGSGKRNRQLAFEHQNSHVCEKRSKHISYFVPLQSQYHFLSRTPRRFVLFLSFL